MFEFALFRLRFSDGEEVESYTEAEVRPARTDERSAKTSTSGPKSGALIKPANTKEQQEELDESEALRRCVTLLTSIDNIDIYFVVVVVVVFYSRAIYVCNLVLG